MGRFGVELLLVAFAVITVLGFIVTYCISVALEHVTPDLPYISDTGGKPPESCIFSLVCNVAILFELLIVYIRYKHIHAFYADDVTTCCVRMKFFNIVSLLIGLISAFGFLLVANFQNDTVPSVHFIGAAVVFSAGLVYQWSQMYISFRIHRSGRANHRSVGWLVVQLIICVASLVFFLGAAVFAALARNYRENNDEQGTFYWSPDDGGFVFHTISTASEWGTSFTLLLFFLTFHPDFKEIQLDITVQRRSEVTPNTYGTSVNESTPLTL
jgi:hypothetical protein